MVSCSGRNLAIENLSAAFSISLFILAREINCLTNWDQFKQRGELRGTFLLPIAISQFLYSKELKNSWNWNDSDCESDFPGNDFTAETITMESSEWAQARVVLVLAVVVVRAATLCLLRSLEAELLGQGWTAAVRPSLRICLASSRSLLAFRRFDMRNPNILKVTNQLKRSQNIFFLPLTILITAAGLSIGALISLN